MARGWAIPGRGAPPVTARLSPDAPRGVFMSKEMVISTTPHETRVAILEEGQLCEIYVEREREFALVGSIYKGRVTRVLPGMQSAFVEIGLDSDAFLYVGDFLENLEDYDHVVTTVEGRVEKMEQQGGTVFAEPPATESPAGEVSAAGDVFPVEVPPSSESEPSPGNDFNTPEPHPFRPAGQQPPRAAGPFVRHGERPQGRAPGGYGRGQGSGPGLGQGQGNDRGGDRGGRRRGGRWRGRGGRTGEPRQGQGRDLPPAKYTSPRPYISRPYEPPSEAPGEVF